MPIRQILVAVTLKDPSIDTLYELLRDMKKVESVEEATVIQTEENKLGVTFERELELLLNRHSKENESNTPDFLLANLVQSTLAMWAKTTNERDKWYGNRSLLGPGNEYPRVTDGADRFGVNPPSEPV